MLSINHLPRRARRAALSTLLASCTAFSLLSGTVPSASAQSAGLSVSINDVAVTEGTDAAAVFTVTVSGRHPNQGITVDWNTRDGTAVDGMDYTGPGATQTLSIPASTPSNDELTGTITVPLIDDATHEPQETFNVKLLSSSVNIAGSGGGTGTATITSDDPLAKLRIRDAQASEDVGKMIFDVDLDRPSSADVTVDFDTCDTKCAATATFNDDYQPTRGTLTFPANTNSTQHIEVPVIDDKVYEGDEQVIVKLSNNFAASIARGTATGTIVEDELKPVLAMRSTGFKVNESDADFVENVDVGLSGLAATDVTFSYSTSDGTAPAAHSPGDYVGTSGTGTIKAGTQLAPIPITIKGDTRPEQDENFRVTISDPSSNARLGGTSTDVTIVDND